MTGAKRGDGRVAGIMMTGESRKIRVGCGCGTSQQTTRSTDASTTWVGAECAM